MKDAIITFHTFTQAKLQPAFNTKNMDNQTTYRKNRTDIEQKVLADYNAQRRKKKTSPMETYIAVARNQRLQPWQVQYIILKAKKAGKEVI